MSTRLYVSTNEATFFNTNVMGCSSSPPSEGSYIIGDFYISTVQQKGVFGWVCIESGTPGVWKDICNIGDVNESIKQNQSSIEDLRARVIAAEKIVKDLELSAGVDVFALEKTVNEAVRNIADHEEDIDYLKSIDTEIKTTVNNTQNIANINKDNIATLTTQVGLNDRDIDVLKAADNDLKSFVSAAQNMANINKDNIATLTTQVGLNDKDIDNVRNLVNSLTSELNGLKSDLNLSGTDITGIRDHISSINSSITLIESKLNRAINDIDILENNFTNLSGSGIQDISKAINDNKNKIANVETNVTAITNNVSSLSKNISDNNTILATLNTRVDGFTTNVVDISNRVSVNAAEIEKLKTQDINYGTRITNLEHYHTRQEQDIQSLDSELAKLATAVDGLENTLNLSGTDVQDLGKTVVKHETDINNLNNSVSQVNNLINTTISDRITKNETDIATIRGSVNSLNSSLGLVDSMVQNATMINNTVMENKQKIDALIQKHDDDIEDFVTNEVFDNFKTEYTESNEGFDSRIDVLEKTVGEEHKTDITNLKNNFNQIEGEIEGINNELINILETIDNNNNTATEDISDLKERVEILPELSTKVGEHTESIQSIDERLTAAEVKVNTNIEDISDLKERVEILPELSTKVGEISASVQDLSDTITNDVININELKSAFVSVLNIKDCNVTIENSWMDLFTQLIGLIAENEPEDPEQSEDPIPEPEDPEQGEDPTQTP